MDRRNSAWWLAWPLALLLVLLGACADRGDPKQSLAEWSAAAARHFVVAPPTYHEPLAAGLWIVRAKTGETMAKRGGTGALAGAGTMGALGSGCHGSACIVLLLAVPAGAIVGGMAGLVSGAVDPDTEEMPFDIGNLDDAGVRALGKIDARRIYEALRDAFIAQARRLSRHDFARQDAGEAAATAGGDTAILSWRNLRVGFVADADDDTSFAFSISGTLDVEAPIPEVRLRSARFPFDYRSGERDFADWSAADGAAVDDAVAKAADSLGYDLAHAIFAREAEAAAP